MATPEDQFVIMTARWQDNLVAAGPTIPTQYDNDGSFTEPESDLWARTVLAIAEAQLLEIGQTKRTRYFGLMTVQLRDDLEKGDQNLLEAIGTIIPFFLSTTVSGITWRTPIPRRIGQDGKWYQMNLVCPFEFDDFHS